MKALARASASFVAMNSLMSAVGASFLVGIWVGSELPPRRCTRFWVESVPSGDGHGTRKPIGRPRIEPETEVSIRAALEKGDIGMRKIAVQFGVATGTVQRVTRQIVASTA
jgi:hypothetical protein